MMSGLLVMTLLVLIPFVLGSARYVVLRSGRPRCLRRVLAARAPRDGLGAGATAAEELNAFLNANKGAAVIRPPGA